MSSCQCGCGSLVKKGNKFIKGHHLRGLKHTEEARRKMSKAGKGRVPWNKGLTYKDDPRIHGGERGYWYGKKLSKEHKKNLSKAAKKESRIKIAINNLPKDQRGKKHFQFGKPRSKETKEKLRRANLGKKQSRKTIKKRADALRGRPRPEKVRRKISEAHKGKKLSDETKDKIRRARLKQIFPDKDTLIETLMQEELKRLNISFETHVPLLGRYQVDLFIAPDVVIECDGDYWHSKSFRSGSVWEKDRERDRQLKEAGYSVFRFWESEIKESPQKCIDAVIEAISEIECG